MSDHPPIVADVLRVHGTLYPRERERLLHHWAKLDQRLQSFRNRTIDIDLHVNERDTPSQHVTLGVKIGGVQRSFVARSQAEDLGQALNEVRDEMIRQLRAAKDRTEPRHNRALRATGRRPGR